MKRVKHLFVLSLTGCLLVASLLSSCTGIHEPRSVPSAGELQPDTSGAESPPTTRVQVGWLPGTGSIFMGGLRPAVKSMICISPPQHILQRPLVRTPW